VGRQLPLLLRGMPGMTFDYQAVAGRLPRDFDATLTACALNKSMPPLTSTFAVPVRVFQCSSAPEWHNLPPAAP